MTSCWTYPRISLTAVRRLRVTWKWRRTVARRLSCWRRISGPRILPPVIIVLRLKVSFWPVVWILARCTWPRLECLNNCRWSGWWTAWRVAAFCVGWFAFSCKLIRRVSSLSVLLRFIISRFSWIGNSWRFYFWRNGSVKSTISRTHWNPSFSQRTLISPEQSALSQYPPQAHTSPP